MLKDVVATEKHALERQVLPLERMLVHRDSQYGSDHRHTQEDLLPVVLVYQRRLQADRDGPS